MQGTVCCTYIPFEEKTTARRRISVLFHCTVSAGKRDQNVKRTISILISNEKKRIILRNVVYSIKCLLGDSMTDNICHILRDKDRFPSNFPKYLHSRNPTVLGKTKRRSGPTTADSFMIVICAQESLKQQTMRLKRYPNKYVSVL